MKAHQEKLTTIEYSVGKASREIVINIPQSMFDEIVGGYLGTDPKIKTYATDTAFSAYVMHCLLTNLIDRMLACVEDSAPVEAKKSILKGFEEVFREGFDHAFKAAYKDIK